MKLAIIAVAFLLLAGCAAPRQWEVTREHCEGPREHYHRELSVEVRENGDGRPQIVATFKITN
jgi:uncharacterized lipoprotein YajG